MDAVKGMKLPNPALTDAKVERLPSRRAIEA